MWKCHNVGSHFTEDAITENVVKYSDWLKCYLTHKQVQPVLCLVG